MSTVLLGYGPDNRSIKLDADERRGHIHCIGASGSGKSKFLENLIRGDLDNQTGCALLDPHGTLCEDVLKYAAYKVARQDVIILNPSRPESVIGFNPFRRPPEGDISVQVDRRVNAVMRSWGVENTDQTPTLARTLRLLFAVMIEQQLGLKQAAHLIDFHAHEVRNTLIEQFASSDFMKAEWQELNSLKFKEWRDETLSAKNRLFKFLTSETLCRFMGLPDRSIDILDAMDKGKVILVNLATSDYLSSDNARTFGALLVNEFYECAKRRHRDHLGRPPRPFHLYIDEFQEFVSLDIDDCLDQTRKFSLFLTLSHQRFGQLDDNITDAVLANCRIKAVFGGLPFDSARRMAQEMFVGKLDPMKVKVAIYQTKFWPKYGRDKVYSKSSSRGSSTGHSSSSSSGYSSSSSSGMSYDGSYFTPDKWYAFTNGFTRSEASTSGSNSMSGSSTSESDSWNDSEGETDVPIFIPVPFTELSSVQYYSLDEQLTEITAALKEQFPRHCFIKIHGNDTEPLLVPLVKDFYTTEANATWFKDKKLTDAGAISAMEADRLIAEAEDALLQRARIAQGGEVVIDVQPVLAATPADPLQPEVLPPSEDKKKSKARPVWNRNL